MRKTRVLACCALTAILSTVHAGSSSIKPIDINMNKPLSKSNNTEEPAKIGYGYNRLTSMPNIRNCFKNNRDPNNIIYSNLVGSIYFDRNLSSEFLSSLTNIDISGKGGFGWFSASVAARYMKASFNSRYSENFNYAQTFSADAIYDLPDERGAALLTNAARQALNEGPEAFRLECGDSYVTGGRSGAVLLVSVGIDFATAADKKTFETNFKGGISGIATVGTAFEQATNSGAVRGTLVLRVLQLGGDPSKLAQIFGRRDFNGDYAIVSCRSGQTQHCKDIVNGIIEYSQKHFGEGVNIKDPKTLYSFSVKHEPYRNRGISVPLPVLTPEAESAQNYVFSQMQEDNLAAGFLVKYMVSPIWNLVDPKMTGIIQTTSNQYQSMIQNYNHYGILSMCYGKNVNTTCIRAANYIKAEHAKINTWLVNTLKKVYIGFSGAGSVVLIPTNPANGHDPQDFLSGTGNFALFEPRSRIFDNTGFCEVDFYKTPTWVNVPPTHNIVCFNSGNSVIPPRMYVKRYNGEPVQDYGRAGRVGYYLNGVPYDLPLNQFGYSTVFTPFNNWDYNPI